MKKWYILAGLMIGMTSNNLEGMNFLRLARKSVAVFQKRAMVQSEQYKRGLIDSFLKNLDQKDPNVFLDGNTMLHWLVTWYIDKNNPYYLQVIKILLRDPRTSCDLPNDDGLTACDLAEKNEDVGQAIKNRDRIILHDAFSSAVRSKNVDEVKVFLQKPDLDVNDLCFGFHMLHYAILKVDYDMVKVLLTHPGFDPNIKDWRGDTALHLLVMWANADPNSRYLELIDLLLSDPRTSWNVPNKLGKTIFDIATNDVVKAKLRELALLVPQLIRQSILQGALQPSSFVM